MPKVKKFGTKHHCLQMRLLHELVDEIEKYLDEKGKLEFDSTANISFADKEMRMIAKNEDKYLQTTLENKNGSEFHHYEI